MAVHFVGLVLVILGTSMSSMAGSTPKGQVHALLSFYNSTGGIYWYNSSNWRVGNPCQNQWYGLSFDGSCNVIAMSLGNNNLTGSIPDTIAQLNYVSILQLNNNNLMGTIPAEIAGLLKIQQIDMSFNKLKGSIPSNIGDLHNNTVILYLNDNYLSGSIPSSIVKLRQLQDLDLSSNFLIGTLPTAIGNLTNIVNMYLNTNNLKGSLPSSLGSLKNASFLWLYENEFSGTIPSTLFTLTNIQVIDLNSNKLTGTIPEFTGKYPNLTELDLSFNRLVGTIPSSIGSLSNANYIALNTNFLMGDIPNSIGSLKTLKNLFLDQNFNLTGSIPAGLVDLDLDELNLSFNQLNGTVPWQNNPHFNYFNVSNNRFSCPLPSWCSSPPTGDGSCAPCVNVTTNQLICCYYSNDDCRDITFSSCAKDFNCPQVVGLQYCGQIVTKSCGKCYPSNVSQ